MNQYNQLTTSASHWGTASTWILIALGVIDLAAFVLNHIFKVKWALYVEVVGLVTLLALGLTDRKVRDLEEQRTTLAESAFLGRRIAPIQHDAAVRVLQAERHRIGIECYGSATLEISQYCNAVRRLFSDGGWEVYGGNLGVYASDGAPMVGVMLASNSRAVGTDRVRAALKVAAISFIEITQQPESNDPLMIGVAQKPSLPD